MHKTDRVVAVNPAHFTTEIPSNCDDVDLVIREDNVPTVSSYVRTLASSESQPLLAKRVVTNAELMNGKQWPVSCLLCSTSSAPSGTASPRWSSTVPLLTLTTPCGSLSAIYQRFSSATKARTRHHYHG